MTVAPLINIGWLGISNCGAAHQLRLILLDSGKEDQKRESSPLQSLKHEIDTTVGLSGDVGMYDKL